MSSLPTLLTIDTQASMYVCAVSPEPLLFTSNMWKKTKTQNQNLDDGCTICMLGKISSISSSDFFIINFFQKVISGIPSDYLTVWIQIKADIPNCCKGYSTGADPGFLERGFKCLKVWWFALLIYLIFLKYLMTMK